jgi:hypothetical protein
VGQESKYLCRTRQAHQYGGSFREATPLGMVCVTACGTAAQLRASYTMNVCENVLQSISSVLWPTMSPSNDAAAAKAPTRAPPEECPQQRGRSRGCICALPRMPHPASVRKTGPEGPADFCEAACDTELRVETLNTG